MRIWDIVDKQLMRKDGIKVDRLPTFYPSNCGCLNEENKAEMIGSCIRANYYRCAGYEVSDPNSVWTEYVFKGGVLWEEFMIDQLKRSGLLIDNNIKFVDSSRWISGEIDILIKNPEKEDGKIIIEHKTFYGYNAKKELIGNKTVKPHPKDSHLLQAFLYLDQFKDQVDYVILTYFARDDHSRQEFKITNYKNPKTKRVHPIISTLHLGHDYEYIDDRVTIEGIYENFNNLMNYLKNKQLPKGSFKHKYSEEEVRFKFESGEIAKTNYEKYLKNPDKNSLGHFMCQSYCQFRTMCKAQKDKDGDE